MARLPDIAFYIGAFILSLLARLGQAQCPIPCDQYDTKYEGQTCGVDPANDSTLLFSVKFCPCGAEWIDLAVSGVLEDGTGFSDDTSFSVPFGDADVVTTTFGFPVRWNDVATSSIAYLTISKELQAGTIVSFTHSPMVSQFFVDATATFTTTLSTVTTTETVPTTTTTTTTIPQQTATSQCTTGTITTTVSTSTSTSTSTITPAVKQVTTTKCKTITTTISCIPPKRNGSRNTDAELHRRQEQGSGEIPFCAPTDGLTPVPTIFTTGTTTVTATISTTTVTDTDTTTLTATSSETPVPATTTICNNVKATREVTATTTTTITTTLKGRTLTKTYTKTSTKTKFYGGKPKCCPTPYKPKGKGGRA